MMTRIVLVTALCCAWASTAAAEAAHVRVVWTEDPAHQAVVSWTSPRKDSGEVFWDTTAHATAADYRSKAISRPAAIDDGVAFAHHTTLANLPPNTAVHFRIVTGGSSSQDFWFQTAPADNSTFALLYGGDSRSDPDARRAINARMRELVSDVPSILALAHGGDYIEWGSSWAQWQQWLDDWQQTVSPDGRVLPIIPARGNHEGAGELFNVVFGFPGSAAASGDWFVTRIGQDFALVTLDSNESQAGEQRLWLDATLRTLQDVRWITANYHRPAYPAVKSPGGALYHWVPLFEQYNLDFVLESDGHVLKRTVPIRAGQLDPTGVVYLGEGGLGVPQRTADTTRWYLQPPGIALSTHHVQLFRVTPEKVFYSAVDAEGEVVDRYEFAPKRLGHAGPAAATIQALPVGKSPPPASPPLFHCATRGEASSPMLSLILCCIAALIARRRTALVFCGAVLLSGCVDDPCRVDMFVFDDLNLQAVGDSVLWWNAPHCASIPDLVGIETFGAMRNSARLGARLTTDDNPIRDQYEAQGAEWVLVSGGGNDLNSCGCNTACDKELRTLSASDGSVGEMPSLVDRIVADGSRVALLGYYRPTAGALYGFGDCHEIIDELDRRYAALAEARPHVEFIDTRHIVDPSNALAYDFDGVHLSKYGALLVAAEIAALIRDH